MKKEITIKEFCKELRERIDQKKTIDCCCEELQTLADMAEEHMGDKMIMVNWKE